MNLKGILQILLLVVLIVAGAGVYLSQQEGGLDFLLETVGLAPEKPPVRVATPTPRRRPPAPPPAAPAKKEPQAPAIPEQPAQGQIQKTPFTVETAEIENGVLTLRQGVEPLATEVRIFLYTKPWHVPAERSFQLLGATGSAPDVPLVRIRFQESGQKAPRQRDFADNYTLRLEFGRERERQLPGKIYLALPDEDKSQVAGTFTAAVRGFRFVDGKPDLASDSVDTLQYLALREILKDDPDKPLNDLVFRRGRYAAVSAVGPATGYLEVEYREGEGPRVSRKFQFIKESNEWRLVRALEPDQLDEAHPYKVPGAKDPPERLLPYLAAQRIEADARKRQPGQAINATEFATRYNEKRKVGVVDVSYKIGDGQLVRTAFLCRLGANGWKLERELGKKERVNLATGKIETQR